MSGEAYLPANMEETVLNTLVMLMGIVVMAFLVGELSNILGNFDPVGNEFEQTVDNLDARSPRFEVFWWFPFVAGTRLRERWTWVVSFAISMFRAGLLREQPVPGDAAAEAAGVRVADGTYL